MRVRAAVGMTSFFVCVHAACDELKLEQLTLELIKFTGHLARGTISVLESTTVSHPHP